MNQNSNPDPERIFRLINSYQAGRALEAAIRLQLFAALGEEVLTAAELAERIRASQRGTRILCDYLTVLEFLHKEKDRYRQTPDSRLFLDAASQSYVGSIVDFLLNPQMVSAFDDLDRVVRKGGTMMSEEGTMEPEHPVWIQFARGMAPLMAPAARFMTEVASFPEKQPLRILDIAAGHGLFGITFAQHHPEAEVFAVDWPKVLDVAEENARKAGIADRFHRLSGSAFEVDYGGNYDAVLVTNFFHHFDSSTCTRLMEKMRDALKAGSKLLTLEFVPAEDRVSPPAAACFPLIMLATTPHGDAYTFSEYDEMLRAAGFQRNELHDVPQSPHQVIVST